MSPQLALISPKKNWDKGISQQEGLLFSRLQTNWSQESRSQEVGYRRANATLLRISATNWWLTWAQKCAATTTSNGYSLPSPQRTRKRTSKPWRPSSSSITGISVRERWLSCGIPWTSWMLSIGWSFEHSPTTSFVKSSCVQWRHRRDFHLATSRFT